MLQGNKYIYISLAPLQIKFILIMLLYEINIITLYADKSTEKLMLHGDEYELFYRKTMKSTKF